ncbi:hypothetical protein GS473_04465 [Rhodococcus hoagii]|nr:hypothetical protein [Prescottella equi]
MIAQASLDRVVLGDMGKYFRGLFWRIPTVVYRTLSALCLIAALSFLVAAVAIDPGSALDWGSPAVAIAALAVAALSRIQAQRSADAAVANARIAELQENRRRFGWQVEPHPTPDHYILRNVGTVTATKVEIANREQFATVRILSAGDGPVSISPGEARVFVAPGKFSAIGCEVHIRWVPESEKEARTWIETVQPSANATALEQRRADRSREDKIRGESLAIEKTREYRDLILKLGDAYSEYRAAPADIGKKLRVQLLVSALPPNMAREIGYEVDVARDVWGPGEHPFRQHVADEDWPLIEELTPQIELMWNMRQLHRWEVYGSLDAAGPNAEPRIWWALRGYVDRVKERESGDRATRRSPEDQRHADQAKREIRDFQARRAGGAGVVDDFDIFERDDPITDPPPAQQDSAS